MDHTPNCICKTCKTPFFVYPCNLRRGRGKYCSPKCANIGTERRQHCSESSKGRHLSDGTREKIRNTLKGRTRPPEHCKNISLGQKGKTVSESTRQKLSEITKQLFKDPAYVQKRNAALKGKQIGEKSHSWKGGISFEPYCPKFTSEFKERVRAFFGYRCVECGTPQNGYKLHVHHVNFNKETCCDNTIPLFVALCRSCHTATNHNREYWEQHFTDMIIGYYGGKCYFTIEETDRRCVS